MPCLAPCDPTQRQKLVIVIVPVRIFEDLGNVSVIVSHDLQV